MRDKWYRNMKSYKPNCVCLVFSRKSISFVYRIRIIRLESNKVNNAITIPFSSASLSAVYDAGEIDRRFMTLVYFKYTINRR